VVLKIKFADFRIITRSKSMGAPVRSAELLAETGRALLIAQLPLRMGARLLGLGVHNLDQEEGAEAGQQLSFPL
jgi:DNA polymerase-4